MQQVGTIEAQVNVEVNVNVEVMDPAAPRQNVYRFSEDCGRHGSLDGILLATPAEIEAAKGRQVSYSDCLGKHSEITLTIDDNTFALVTDNPADVATLKRLGVAAFGYGAAGGAATGAAGGAATGAAKAKASARRRRRRSAAPPEEETEETMTACACCVLDAPVLVLYRALLTAHYKHERDYAVPPRFVFVPEHEAHRAAVDVLVDEKILERRDDGVYLADALIVFDGAVEAVTTWTWQQEQDHCMRAAA